MLSDIIGFFAAATPSVDWYTLPKGTAIEGGYFAGIVTQADGDYAVITAPKSSETNLAIDTNGASNPSTLSTYNGLANTLAMNAANYPAAQYCLNYSNVGYTDWYLPAKDELEVCYRYLKPSTASNETTSGTNTRSVPTTANYTISNPGQTSVVIFQALQEQAFDNSGTLYNTSTQSGNSTNFVQRFSNGGQGAANKTNSSYIVRPVRRVKI